jgi:hypothetical protein
MVQLSILQKVILMKVLPLSYLTRSEPLNFQPQGPLSNEQLKWLSEIKNMPKIGNETTLFFELLMIKRI